MSDQQQKQAILNCVYKANELGFAQVSQSGLATVLGQLRPQGLAYIRDSIVLGMDIINRFYEICLQQSTLDQWHVFQIIIIDGADGGSLNSPHILKNLLINSFQKYPKSFFKLIILYINIDNDPVATQELQEFQIIGQCEIIQINSNQIDDGFAKIQQAFGEYNKQNIMILLNIEISASIQVVWVRLQESLNKFIRSLNKQDLLGAIGFSQIFQILKTDAQLIRVEEQIQPNNRLAERMELEQSRNMKKYALRIIILIVVFMIIGAIIRLTLIYR